MKIYAEILAGGKGSRMGRTDMPKQFLMLGDKPIIIHTIGKFLLHEKIDVVLVVTPKAWINHTEDIIEKYIENTSKIIVVEGGSDRNSSIMNGIKYIKENIGLEDEDIIVTHDAVRPFLNYRIIEDNINTAIEFGSTDTVISAIDTIVVSKNFEDISEIPVRDMMYQGQTPQSFNIKLLISHYEALTVKEKEVLTDAAKILVLKGEKVRLVKGENYNIKITTPYDLIVANAILNRGKIND